MPKGTPQNVDLEQGIVPILSNEWFVPIFFCNFQIENLFLGPFIFSFMCKPFRASGFLFLENMTIRPHRIR